MNYGQKIADLRKENKLTQAELGNKLNVTAQAVSKWENGLSEPDIESIKKMCEIFGVSVDEFLGVSKKENDTDDEEDPTPIKIISGYCEKCKKPVGPDEYVITHLSYNPASITQKVQRSENQHIFCKECHKQITSLQKTEERNAQLAKLAYEAEERKRNFFKGLIWGGVITLAVALICFGSYFAFPSPDTLTGAIVLTVGAFTLSSQLFWNCDGFLSDFFLFFCRSFKWPFGFIFELSLDGILWLITVKLALWIICGILSILFFLLGLFLSILLSVPIFPFALIRNIKEL